MTNSASSETAITTECDRTGKSGLVVGDRGLDLIIFPDRVRFVAAMWLRDFLDFVEWITADPIVSLIVDHWRHGVLQDL